MEPYNYSAEKDQESFLTGKLLDLLAEEETTLDQFPFQEEMVEEVMRDLYREIAHSVSSPAPPPPPPPSPAVFLEEGKNGSCGATVSAAQSTVMAGIQVPAVENAGGGYGGEDEGFDFDDEEWLGRVLSWGEQNQQVRNWWE